MKIKISSEQQKNQCADRDRDYDSQVTAHVPATVNVNRHFSASGSMRFNGPFATCYYQLVGRWLGIPTKSDWSLLSPPIAA